MRRKRRGCRGSILVETAMALSMLTALGLGMLKLSINLMAPRQWTLQQTVTDAYMTYERALAERTPFERISATDSDWPLFPAVAEIPDVELGKLPGGRAIHGSVTRTRQVDGGTPQDDDDLNPARMRVWRLQSVLRYEVGGRTYVKSRTVVRSQ